MTARRYRKRICQLALALSLATLAFAQNDRGIIAGTVMDPTGAVIPDVTVTAKNAANGAVYEARTTSTGDFTLAQLPPAIYEITVQASGFEKYVGTGTEVHVGIIEHINITLQVGAATESVTVQATAPLLKVDSAEQSVDENHANIIDLTIPGNGSTHNARSLMIITPGVAGQGIGNPNSGRVDGQPPNTQRVFVDGQDVTNENSPSVNTGPPPADMVQEFSLQTSNYAAEYGQVQGGVFIMATRSGVNQIHGDLWEYWQNNLLDAKKPFVYTAPLDRKDDFGATFSGPVFIPRVYNGHNKTFFFLIFEDARNSVSTAGSLNTVPTLAYRQGNFSSALTGRAISGTDPLGNQMLENAIYDPSSTQLINGVATRTMFPGNIIPASRLDPVALKIQNLIPTPIFSGNLNNWPQGPQYKTWSAQPAFKIDHNFSATQHVSFYLDRPSNRAPGSEDGLPLPITQVTNNVANTWIPRLNWDDNISPTMLLHVGLGMFRNFNPGGSSLAVEDYNASGLLGFNGSAIGHGFPQINGLGTSTAGGMNMNMGPTNLDVPLYTKLTGVISLLYVRGNHSYKIGGEFRNEAYADNQSTGGTGDLNFSALETGQTSLQGQNTGGISTGFPYASFLLGLADNGTVQPSQDLQWRSRRYALYIQDTWRVNHKLTLDYGLRWDLQGEGHEIWNRDSMFGPSIPNPSAGNLPGGWVYEGYGANRCDCYFAKPYPYAIGPRFGFAYQLTPKTVVRGGWGIVTAAVAPSNSFTTSATVGLGYNQLVFNSPSYGVPAITLSSGLQYSLSSLYAATLSPGARPTSPGSISSINYFIDPNANRPGRTYTYSVNVQRELFRNLVVEAAYVGNRAIWIIGATGLVNLNATPISTLTAHGLSLSNPADITLLTSTLSSPTAAARGFGVPYAGYPTSQTVAQSLRPYPMYNSTINPMWAPLGDGWYNSLQSKITKRYSFGLTASVAFTFSQELATGQVINNVYNRNNQKSLVSTSQPYLFVAAYTYELYDWVPHVTSSKWADRIWKGWKLGGIMRYSSGLPIQTPNSQNDMNSLVYQSTLMNRVPGQPLFLKDLNCHCIDPYHDLVLNPKAWQDVPNGQWGTSAPYYNDYRGERFPSENMNLARIWKRETWSLEFRGEFFNVFNRLVLPGPSTGNPLATTTYNSAGQLTGGFGYINASSVGGERTGQFVIRVKF
jgi:hypothetical protein